ncbi:M48 family metalloprotease [Nocardia sp. IBHARD005]|uniref:M48 family metalloprotease n=1 Tax=Nocardia sp. IBHARD005 TaxID=3457765 RepID=UPI004059599F
MSEPMIYLLHHLITLGLCAATTLLWVRRSWRHRSPHVTLIAGQLTMFAAVFAVIGLFLSAGLAPYREGVVPGLATLVTDAASRASLGIAHRCLIGAGCVVAAGLLVTVTWCGYRTHRRRRRLRALLSVVSTGTDALPGMGVQVIDHPALAAYCIPGRHSNVVISQGTLQALGPDELRAVVAHERAHVAMRHDLALFPFVTLYQLLGHHRAAGRVLAEMQLLIEMCADDRAARRHGRSALRTALMTFQHNDIGSSPKGMLAAADIAVTQRCSRLAHPPKPLPAAITLIAITAATALMATPISLYLLPL